MFSLGTYIEIIGNEYKIKFNRRNKMMPDIAFILLL
tara:strand:+ start:2503 stop:2610 length:108 start_codon:yes stop_codon:yes gene_type:complete